MVDQYAVLELQPGADSVTVRAAYRRLARQFHPDVNRAPEAAERMRALNAAYEALTSDATPGSLAPAATTPSAARTAARPAPAPRGADFWYRWAASSAQGGGAVAVGSHSHQAITAGVVAGFFLLVAVFAGWAFAVARPTVTAAPATSASRAQTSSSSMQSTTGSAAAQLSANAAANAAAVRSNVGAAGTTSAAGLSGASSVAPAPTAAAPSTTSASQPNGGVSVAGISLESRPAVQEKASASQEPAPIAQPEVRTPSQRPVMPSVPVAPSAPSNTGQSIQAVSAQLAQPAQLGDPSSAPAAAATRALSNYDKAWTGYASALRSATASGMLSSAGTSAMRTGPGASAFLSSDAQLTMARTLYIQQQLAFNAQMAPALAAAPASAARPDAAKAARAELRLRQAAELVAQAQATGIPAPAAQVKSLLDEAEQAHREWVAEWARLLASAA